MKIGKITFKNKQAWIVIKSDDGVDYLGTWHCVDVSFVEELQKEMPQEIYFYKRTKGGE